MSTIISRVVASLRANGRPDDDALAAELITFVAGLKTHLELLFESQHRAQALVKQYVSVVQSRCKHFQWSLQSTNVDGHPGTWGPEDTIVCFECGHTVCDEAAWKFGKRVMQGGYHIFSHGNGRRFGLSPDLRRKLGDKLIVKEIKADEPVQSKALRDGGNSAGGGEAPNRSAVAGNSELHTGDERPESERSAVAEGCGDADQDVRG